MKKITKIEYEYEETDVVKVHGPVLHGEFVPYYAQVIEKGNMDGVYCLCVISGKDVGETENIHQSHFTYVPKEKYEASKIKPVICWEVESFQHDLEFYPMEEKLIVGCQTLSYEVAFEIASIINNVLLEKPKKKTKKAVK